MIVDPTDPRVCNQFIDVWNRCGYSISILSRSFTTKYSKLRFLMVLFFAAYILHFFQSRSFRVINHVTSAIFVTNIIMIIETHIPSIYQIGPLVYTWKWWYYSRPNHITKESWYSGTTYSKEASYQMTWGKFNFQTGISNRGNIWRGKFFIIHCEEIHYLILSSSSISIMGDIILSWLSIQICVISSCLWQK